MSKYKPLLKICPVCNQSFEVLYNIEKTCCSRKCFTKHLWNTGKMKPHLQSKESNLKRSQKLIGIKRSENFKRLISKAQKGTPEKEWVKKQVSEIMIKKWKDPTYSKNQVEKIMLGKLGTPFGNKAFYREDLKCFFRSRWEANLARFFNYLEVPWKYEPHKIKLNDGTCYIPDFYMPLSGIYFEVKGYVPDRKWYRKFAKAILEENLPIFPVNKSIYTQLEKEYDWLPGWENERIYF